MEVRFKQLPHGAGLSLPTYQSAFAAGMDLPAAVVESIRLEPGMRALIPTGLVIELPPGYEGQVRPRSGLAMKHGITVLNAPGTIDADYRGEVQVLLVNLGEAGFTIERGMRIAQLVIAPVVQVRIALCEDLSDTQRGAGGFGSSGV